MGGDSRWRSGHLRRLTFAPRTLYRRVTGDWGELGAEDKSENEFSLRNGFRILSRYELTTESRLWIITEADRSVTTLLLPEEY